jgi:20S proteasome alpha/beta subunit
MYNPPSFKYKLQVKRRSKMTCIIGGKCIDGIVLTCDRKSKDVDTDTDEYIEKIFLDYYPIVTAGAGANISFHKFKEDAKAAAQKAIAGDKLPFDFSQISGMFQKYPILAQDKAIIFTKYQREIEDIVHETNKRYYTRVGENFDVLVAIQIHPANTVLTYIGPEGAADEIGTTGKKYKVIGSGEPFARVFLKPLWSDDMTMEKFSRLSYFIIKFLDRFSIIDGVGLGGKHPQIWFVPNEGQIYNDKDRPEIIEKLEAESNKMLDRFEQKGIDALL